MRRLTAKGFAATVGIASAQLCFGCEEDESMLFVQGVLMASPPECKYRADESATLLAGGTLDVGFGRGYLAGLLVGNQLAAQGDKERSRTETSRISLNGAEIRLLGVSEGGEHELGFFSSPGTGFINPSEGADAGYGVVAVMVIPDAEMVAGEVGRYVIAEIRVFGETLGGREIESNVYRFPIEVCWGCLVTFDSIDGGGQCFVESGATGTEDPPCRFGQDEVVSCTTCMGSFPDVCAVAPSTN